MDNKITIKKFEKKIWEKEGIRLVIRASSNEKVKDYNYKNSCPSSTVSYFKENRLKPLLGKKEFDIIDGYGNYAHGNTKIQKVAQSYK